jgi:hypothetical protein
MFLPELLPIIYSYLPVEEQHRCRLVSREWSTIILYDPTIVCQIFPKMFQRAFQESFHRSYCRVWNALKAHMRMYEPILEQKDPFSLVYTLRYNVPFSSIRNYFTQWWTPIDGDFRWRVDNDRMTTDECAEFRRVLKEASGTRLLLEKDACKEAYDILAQEIFSPYNHWPIKTLMTMVQEDDMRRPCITQSLWKQMKPFLLPIIVPDDIYEDSHPDGALYTWYLSSVPMICKAAIHSLNHQ